MAQTRSLALHNFICRIVRDVVNENVAEALTENAADASKARTLLQFRERLKFQTANRILDDYAMAELSAILRKTIK